MRKRRGWYGESELCCAHLHRRMAAPVDPFHAAYARRVRASWYTAVGSRDLSSVFDVPTGSTRRDEMAAYGMGVGLALWPVLGYILAFVSLLIPILYCCRSLCRNACGRCATRCCGDEDRKGVPFHERPPARVYTVVALVAFCAVVGAGIALMVSHYRVHNVVLTGVSTPATNMAASLDDLAVRAHVAALEEADSIDVARVRASAAATAALAHNAAVGNAVAIVESRALALRTTYANFTTTEGDVFTCAACAAAGAAATEFVAAAESNLGRSRIQATSTVVLIFVGATGDAATDANAIADELADVRNTTADIKKDVDDAVPKVERYEAYYYTWGGVFLGMGFALAVAACIVSLATLRWLMRTVSVCSFILASLLWLAFAAYLMAAVIASDLCVEGDVRARELTGYYDASGALIQTDGVAAKVYRACESNVSLVNEFDVSEWIELLVDIENEAPVAFAVPTAADSALADLVAATPAEAAGVTDASPQSARDWLTAAQAAAAVAAAAVATARAEYAWAMANATVVYEVLAEEQADARALEELRCGAIHAIAVDAYNTVCDRGVRALVSVAAWSAVVAFALGVLGGALLAPGPLRFKAVPSFARLRDTVSNERGAVLPADVDAARAPMVEMGNGDGEA